MKKINWKLHATYLVALILLSSGTAFAMINEKESNSQLELTRAYYDSIATQREEQVAKYEEAQVTLASS